ncbi:MAG: hypothetical protein ACR2RF_05880, partial [Geminicoccaceae bacterium]
RVVRILGEDDAETTLVLNQIVGQDDDGPIMANDITLGRYDVVVSTGPSFSSRRQESAESMMRFVEVFPQAAVIAGDLIAKAQDWPGAELFAQRFEQLQQPSEPDPKAQADAAKSAADAEKKRAEAEGQQLENIEKQLVLATQTGILQQLLSPIIQEQVQIALGAPQGALNPQFQ